MTLEQPDHEWAMFAGPIITPAGFSPLPKNPIIASFFSAIGLAEEPGSGTYLRARPLPTGVTAPSSASA